MSMPKGKKVSRGYANSCSGENYRSIAKIYSSLSDGQVINHSSARNYTLSAMELLAKDFCRAYGVNCSTKNISKIASSPYFHSAMTDIIGHIAIGKLE